MFFPDSLRKTVFVFLEEIGKLVDQKVREATDPLLGKIVELTDYVQKLEEHMSELSKEVDDVNQQGRKEYLILDEDVVPKF